MGAVRAAAVAKAMVVRPVVMKVAVVMAGAGKAAAAMELRWVPPTVWLWVIRMVH